MVIIMVNKIDLHPNGYDIYFTGIHVEENHIYVEIELFDNENNHSENNFNKIKGLTMNNLSKTILNEVISQGNYMNHVMINNIEKEMKIQFPKYSINYMIENAEICFNSAQFIDMIFPFPKGIKNIDYIK
jgi:hypothetical protein